jgi:flavin-dependent dehydrogenase
MSASRFDVVVIGAGPSGAIASALLKRDGWNVLVVEAQRFPRFAVGESLLAHCLDFVQEAGMLDALERHGFQYKDGAAFVRGEEQADISFADRFTRGFDHAFQVDRASFDKLLADQAALQGVDIRYETRVVAFDNSEASPRIRIRDPQGQEQWIEAGFVLDASGFARVLPKMLDLETPSDFPVRTALVTHVADNAAPEVFDRRKVHIVVHPKHSDVWYWIIPFPNNRCSIGCVAPPEFMARYPQPSQARLQTLLAEDAFMSRALANAHWDTAVRENSGYSANVRTMHGKGFALLGNAAEFLDPIFSSGVTIAMRSSSLAAQLLNRQLRGASVDWASEFETPMRKGVAVFRVYVDAWYDGRFQRVMFAKNKTATIRQMINSILAGYAWDESNPFVTEAERRLDLVAQICR